VDIRHGVPRSVGSAQYRAKRRRAKRIFLILARHSNEQSGERQGVAMVARDGWGARDHQVKDRTFINLCGYRRNAMK
jgi:hypothetical protein